MENCVFCKIIKKEIPAQIVYENEEFICIFDAMHTTLGHTLIIPKKHSENILNMEDYNLLKVIKKTHFLLKEKFGFEGFNIVSNIGTIAGQTVMHTHLHLIPRYEKDDFTISFSKNEELLKKAKEII